ncbi:uncharacterized protein LOC131935270 [Physella acuta]|uniref:uncharacterized protein LOC131935270 n=1 Tax=Physella acuta TaxID=109671 RepID=UPI0027DC396C|nr:uncharacterized protein LOC131935270 [Physella acuta]
MEALLFLLLALPVCLSGPVNWQYDGRTNDVTEGSAYCSTHCTGLGRFQYEVGKTYRYNYEVVTSTSMHGASEDVASTEVKAMVNILVVSKCELVLSLSGVTITRSDPNNPSMKPVTDQGFKSALEGNSLRFSFQDGRIEDVCPGENEETASLNFKRGILSAFQNSMTQNERDESMKEVDVVGTCPTSYTVSQKGTRAFHFVKSKDLLGCTDRHSYRTSLKSTAHYIPDTIQSSALLKGNHKCTQVVSKEGYLQSSTCLESLVFRPFSKQEAGARTETTQKLTYYSASNDLRTVQEAVSSRTSLLFEHTTSMNNDGTLWSVREKLTELCRITLNDFPAEVPSLYTDLIYLMRNLDSSEITDIVDKLFRKSICEENNDLARKFLLDAIPMVGTSSSVDVMVQMLLSGQVIGTQGEMWIQSLHFIQNPTSEMLPFLKKLLMSENHQKLSALPVTSLIRNLCSKGTDCLYSKNIEEIVNVLGSIISNRCQSDDKELMLIILRAIGNLGFADRLVPALEKCVKLNTNTMNIRVFAAQAFRGVTCNVDRKSLMDTFMDTNEDSELRITAYLGVMQCWNEDNLVLVKQTLEKETTNQVGSFVWTHLTNLLETSSPHKQALRDILNDEKLKKEFNLDKWKFSRNYEVSFYSDKFGLGTTAESNMIWSADSFLPRSAMVNLTVDMLGHSINFVEVGGRVQGLDALLQNYLGSKLFNGEKVKDSSPSSCVKKEKMEKMKNQFSVDKDDFTASMYIRMFGNEIGFHHFQENEISSLPEKLKSKFSLESLLKGDEISYTQNVLFLESQMAVPTVAGLPLTLSVNGTANVDLQVQGILSMKTFSLKKLQTKFDIRPSGAIQLSGMMSVGAGATRSGLKMVSQLHTSTSVAGKFELKDGQVLTAELDTPKKNMDVFSFKSEFFILHDTVEKKQEMLKDKKVSVQSCSSNTFLKFVGYELCGSISYINASAVGNMPYFPFTGPASIKFTVANKDVPNGFKMSGKQIQNPASSTAQLSIDTPGSKQDRKISISYYVDKQDKTAEAEFISQWRKVSLKGTYFTEPNRALSASVTDNGKEYKVLIQASKVVSKSKTVWKPTLDITVPQDANLKIMNTNLEKLSVTGTVELDTQLKDIKTDFSFSAGNIPFNLDLNGNFINKEQQKTLAGTVSWDKANSYSATVQLLQKVSNAKSKSGQWEPTILISDATNQMFLLSGKINHVENRSLQGDLQVKMDRVLSQPISLDFLQTLKKRTQNQEFQLNTNLKSQFITLSSNASFVIPAAGAAVKKAPPITSRITLDYNLPLLKTKELRKNKVLLTAKIQNKSNKSNNKYIANFIFDSKNYPDANFDTTIDIQHNKADTKYVMYLKHGAKAKSDKAKDVDLTIEATVSRKIETSAAEINYNFKFLYPPKSLEYEVIGKHMHDISKKLKLETYANFIYGKGKFVEVRLMANDFSMKNVLNATGLLEVSFPLYNTKDQTVESKSYSLVSSVFQDVNKDYIHTISLTMDKKFKHSAVTKFMKLKNGQFNFSSEIEVRGDKPSKVTLQVSSIQDTFGGSVNFVINKDVYGAGMSLKIEKSPLYTFMWNVIVPDTSVKGMVMAGKKQVGEAILNFEVSWDDEKDKTQNVGVSFYAYRPDNSLFNVTIVATTSFENHKIYQISKTMKNNPKEYQNELKMIWGMLDNQLSYTVWLALPASVEKFEMKMAAVTPWAQVKKVGLDMLHKWDGSRYLSTGISGTYNDAYLTTVVKYTNRNDVTKNDISASLNVTSSYAKCRNVLVSLSHTNKGKNYATEAVYERNENLYKVRLTATFLNKTNEVLIDSKLEVLIPLNNPMNMQLMLTGSEAKVNSTVSFTWKPEYNSKLVAGAVVNRKMKDYALDVALSLPLKEFSHLEVQIRHNMLNSVTGSGYVRVNKNDGTSGSLTYSGSRFVLSTNNGLASRTKAEAVYVEYPYTFVFSHDWQDIKTRITNTISLDGSVSKSSNGDIKADVKVLTPFDGARNLDLSGTVMKKTSTAWNFGMLASVDVGKEITVDVNVGTSSMRSIDGSIKTPFKELSQVNFGHTFDIDEKKRYKGESYLEVQPYFNKVKLNMEQDLVYNRQLTGLYRLEIPDTELKTLEINYETKQNKKTCNTDVKINYSPNKEIKLSFIGNNIDKTKFPADTSLKVDLTTPYEILPTLNIRGNIDKSKDIWKGELSLDSESRILKFFKVKGKHSATETSTYNDIEISSSLSETVAAGVQLDWGDAIGANFTLTAPSVKRTMIGFKKLSNSWTDFQNKIFAAHNGYDLDLDVGLKHRDESTRAWLTYGFPGADTSYIKATVHRDGMTTNDFNIGGFLQVGKTSRPYNVSMQYSNLISKTALGTTLETPYTKSLSYYLKRENSEELGKRILTVYGKYGQKYLIDFYTSMGLSQTKFEYNIRNEYLFDGVGRKAGTIVSSQWQPNGVQVEAELDSYYNDHKVNIELGRNVETVTSAMTTQNAYLKVKTSFQDYNDVGLRVAVDCQDNKHEGTITLVYKDDNEAVLLFNALKSGESNWNVDSTLTLPIVEYKSNKLNYKHVFENNKLTANAVIIAGNGEQLGGKMILANNNDMTLTVTGPFKAFEFLTVTGKYNEKEQKVNGRASLKLTLAQQPATLDYDIDNNNYQPVNMNFKLDTPYQNVKSLSLAVEHFFQGWSQVKTTSTLKSEVYGEAKAKSNLSFRSILDMYGDATVTGTIKNMENLKLNFKSKESGTTRSSLLNFGWQAGKEITLVNKYDLARDDESTKLTADLELATPFDEAKMANLKLTHTFGQKTVSEAIVLTHNNKDLLDVDLSYKFGDKHEGNINMKSPRPMAMSLVGMADPRKLDGTFKLNWDKLSPESNIEIVSFYNDKSDDNSLDKNFKFRVLHPARIMGLTSSFKKSDKEMLSSGQISWDEHNSNTFLYDISWLNRTSMYSKMYEGHVKVGVPQRSVKIQGSHSDVDNSQTTYGAFFWDAEKDEKKKVTMTTTVEDRDNLKRVNLNINLPTINKQLNLGATTRAGYGSTLVDSKAEISYSSDPRKTITVTSVITNSHSSSQKNYNYTADLTFEHPVTNTNIQITSHVGKVENICSAGSKFTFFTANMEQKSLEFWTKLDRENKLMDLKVATPIKTVAIQGKVDETPSYQQIVITSYEDDKQTLNLNLARDMKRKKINVEFNYDNENPRKMVSMVGRYVNDSAVQVDILSQNGGQPLSEAMIAFRLNTSQILHTRVLWRPTLFNEMQTYLGTKITAFSYSANEVFANSVNQIGVDVKAKYLLISQELMSEMGQVFDLMDKEMHGLSKQMETVRTEFRRFYQRNDLNIKLLGDSIKAAFDNMLKDLQTAVLKYRAYCNSINDATSDWLNKLKTYPIAYKYTTTVEELVNGLKNFRGLLEKALKDVSVEMGKFSDISHKKYLELSRSLDRKLMSYTRSIHELPMYKRMMQQVQGSLPGQSDWMNTMYMKWQQMLQDQYHDFMARPEFQHTYAVASEFYQQINYWKAEKSLDAAVERLLELAKSLVILELSEIKKTLEGSRVIVYDLERGELQFEVHMPVAVNSLTEVPKLKVNSYLNNLQQWTKVNVPSSITDTLNGYYDYVPYLQPSKWKPAFYGSAYIVGSQHFFTFDESQFDFSSTCNYILVRDMLNDSFSVVVNYEKKSGRPQIKSLCFTIEDSYNFEISDDYKIKVLNKEAEMPLTTEKVKIVRDGDFIRVNYYGGLEVVSNPKLDMYQVKVAGWYHGKLSGMLGRYDNEPVNDKVPDTKLTSFEVTKKSCNSKNVAVAPRSPDVSDLCEKVFRGAGSKYKPCFKKVDPSPFINLCRVYKTEMAETEAVTKVIDQYRFMCEEYGVYLGAHKDYNSCSNPEMTNEIPESTFKTADVLFVVEENLCNSWAATSLTSVVTEINKILSASDMTENRFGLLTYGGVDNDNLVRTINGQHFGEASTFLKATETLRSLNSPATPYFPGALKSAMDYPFRADAAKILIVAPCSSCDGSYLEKKYLTTLTQSKGFLVHLLQKQDFKLDSSISRPRKFRIYGVDNTKAFTNDPVSADTQVLLENIEGTTDEDFCQELVESLEGSVFDTANFNEKPKQHIDFVQSFAKRVGLNIKSSPCQTCTCNADSGERECQLCNASSLPYYLHFEPPSVPKVLKTFNDLSHEVKRFIGLA